MTRETEYQRRIALLDGSGLVRLWEQIEAGTAPKSDWEPGRALEFVVLRAFQLENAEVRWPYRVELAGEVVEEIDGTVYSDSLCCLVECKDQEKVDFRPVAKMRNQLLRRPAGTIGAVFSRGGFSEPAIILAQFTAPQCIILWGGVEIGHALRNQCMRRALLAKYRHWVEHARPWYNIVQEGFG